MLTIQPNLTTKTYSSRNVSFRNLEDISESDYRNQEHFYEGQIREANKIINSEHSPEILKKGMNWVKIISNGILEGWAVLWGAAVGAKTIKKGSIKFANSRFMQKLGTNLRKFGQKINEKFGEGVSKKVAEFTEKLSKNDFGSKILKGISTVTDVAKKGLAILGKPFKGKSAEEIYDKGAKAVATTLGVGSGAAGIYSEARKEQLEKIKANIENEDNDEDCEVA
jgi:hypothetical protein